ncbi:MAG: hypothetical protein Q7R80_05125 [bacterium]|nr:hypothetical protein [bacterium]
MPRKKREAEASPPATAQPTFAELIEAITTRYEALAKRAAANAKIAAEVRRNGRGIVGTLRSFVRLESLLDLLDSVRDAFTEICDDGLGTAPARARTQPIHRISSTQVQLRLVRARAKGEAELEAEKQAIHRESGLGMPRISALLARTNGKNRLQWARKFLLTVPFGDDRKQLADELSGYGYGPAAKLLRGLGR